MQNKHEILEIFPTTIYKTTIPEQLSSIVHFFDEQTMGTETDSDNYGFRSENSYVLNDPKCEQLRDFILSHVLVYGQYLGYDYNEYRFSQSWISVKSPGQHHSAHTHPNSLLSGVLYYGPVLEQTSAISFHNSKMGVSVPHIAPKMVSNAQSLRYAQEKYTVMIEPGLLLLFPSYLIHSVPLNKTEKPRCSLAFNVVPKIGFGNEKFLTELIF